MTKENETQTENSEDINSDYIETNYISNTIVPEELKLEASYLALLSNMYEQTSQNLIDFIENNFKTKEDKILIMRITFKQITLYPNCRHKFIDFFEYFHKKYDIRLHHGLIIRSNPILFSLLYERGVYTLENVKDCMHNNIIFFDPTDRLKFCYSFVHRFLFAPEFGLKKSDCPEEYMYLYDQIQYGKYDAVYDIRRHSYVSNSIEYYIKNDMINEFILHKNNINGEVMFSRFDNINPEFYPIPIKMDVLSFAIYYKADKIINYLLSNGFQMNLSSYLYSIRSGKIDLVGTLDINCESIIRDCYDKYFPQDEDKNDINKNKIDVISLFLSEALTSCKEDIFDYLVDNFKIQKASFLFPARTCNTKGIVHSVNTNATGKELSDHFFKKYESRERSAVIFMRIFAYNYNISGINFLVENGHSTALKYVLEKGISYEPKNELINPVSMAAIVGFVECIKLLVQYGYDINEISSYKTPLIYASWYGNVNVVEFLLLNCADIDFVDLFGFTALHYAVYFHHIDVILLLLQANANPNAKAIPKEKSPKYEVLDDVFDFSRAICNPRGNYNEKTPKEIASILGYDDIVDLFNEFY